VELKRKQVTVIWPMICACCKQFKDRGEIMFMEPAPSLKAYCEPCHWEKSKIVPREPVSRGDREQRQIQIQAKRLK
jgi:hypothetical protein